MGWRTCSGPIRLATSLAVLSLFFSLSPGTFGFEVGDRVDVKRGLEWARGTVTNFDSTRNRYTVRLDDDGSLSKLSPEQREKRLTRNYFPSDMREVRGADNPPPATTTPSSPSPATPGSTVTIPPDAVAPRTWSDKSGRFKIEATYRGMNGAKVVLEKADGTKIEVELAKLSEADNEYVNAQTASAENPFDVPAMSSGRTGTGGAAPGMVQADMTSLKTIEPEQFSSWSFKPSGGVSQPAGVPRPQRIALSNLPDSERFFEEVESISVSADGQRVLLMRKQGQVSHENQVYVEEIDLEAGQVVGVAPLPQQRELLALSAQHGLVVWKAGHSRHDDRRVGVGRMQGGQLTPLGEFEPQWPGRDLPAAFNDADKAWIVGPSHVMLSGFHHDVMVVWDVVQMKAAWAIPVRSTSDSVTLSPDGSIAAFPLEGNIALIDLREGKHVATVTGVKSAESSVSHMAFNPEMTRLAIQAGHHIEVVDLATGKSISRFQPPTLAAFGRTTWAGDFLLNGMYVLDPHHRVLLWEFTGDRHQLRESVAAGKLMVSVSQSRDDKIPHHLHTHPVPTQAMIDLAASLGDPESLVIARPGDKIAIDLEVDPGVANEDDIYRKLVVSLERAGFEVVVDDVPLVLKGYCKQRPSETIRINSKGSSPWAREEDIIERTITPHPTFVSISFQGTEIWRRGSSGQPGALIWLEEGESIDQALERLTTPNLKVFEEMTVELPLIKPGKATSHGAYGKSEIGGTSRGGRFK